MAGGVNVNRQARLVSVDLGSPASRRPVRLSAPLVTFPHLFLQGISRRSSSLATRRAARPAPSRARLRRAREIGAIRHLSYRYR